jgi:hypothetical protein
VTTASESSLSAVHSFILVQCALIWEGASSDGPVCWVFERKRLGLEFVRSDYRTMTHLHWETAVFFSSSVLSIYNFGALLGRFVGGNGSPTKEACKAACLGASILILSYMVGGATTCVAMRMNGLYLPYGMRAEFASLVLHYTNLTWFVAFPLFIGLSLKLCQLRRVNGPRALGCGGEHL